MGCERFRDGGLGVGGVRASVERRWLVNAKTTMMRQKKWQEVRMQKELEEMKKVTEILEKRKQERARLAAYIHVQPGKGSSTNPPKSSRTENKRTRWNSFLMEDQEVIMKFREKSAVAHNSYTNYHQKTNHAAAPDTFWKVSERVQPHGGYTHSYLKGYHVPDQNFGLGCRYVEERTAYENYDNPFKYRPDGYHLDMDQLSEVSAAKYSTKSESVRQPTWAPDVPAYASMIGETRRDSAVRSQKHGANAVMKGDAPPKAVQSASVHVAEKRGGAYMVDSQLEALRQGGTCSTEHRSDLREEILKARQANEEATARLIAEANAIESRLENCDLKLEPLDFRDAEPDEEAQVQLLLQRDDALSVVSLGETSSNFSSGDALISGLICEKSPEIDQLMESTTTAASDPQLSADIDWNSVTVGSPKCEETKMVRSENKSGNQEKEKPEEDQSLEGLMKKETSHFPSPKDSTEIDWNTPSVHYTESNKEPDQVGFQATRQAHSHHKTRVGEDPTPETNISWDINWDTPTKRSPLKKLESVQSSQRFPRSSTPTKQGEWKVPQKQRLTKQHLMEIADAGSLKEERQRFESCCRRAPPVTDTGDMFRSKEDHVPPLPQLHPNFGFSQSTHRASSQEQRTRFARRSELIGGDENNRKSQTGVITDEEEKIFASLERLDWKLAALHSRSVSTGRDSFVSQDEFSTKSAPAVMRPSIRKLGLAGLQSAQKTLPYSTMPPRPLVCPPRQQFHANS